MDEFDLRDKRREYVADGLDLTDLAADPVAQFGVWFRQAHETVAVDVTAMTLATVSADGQPSVRTVLLKHFDRDNGFAWYTDYRSKKGQELQANPKAALLFYWQAMNRQIRIEGMTSRLAAVDSERYFHDRPRGSQISAAISRQSAPIADREALEALAVQCRTEYQRKPIPRPAEWGGYVLKPTLFEFWQGRENRLHDRFQYTLTAHAGWQIERLQP